MHPSISLFPQYFFATGEPDHYWRLIRDHNILPRNAITPISGVWRTWMGDIFANGSQDHITSLSGNTVHEGLNLLNQSRLIFPQGPGTEFGSKIVYEKRSVGFGCFQTSF